MMRKVSFSSSKLNCPSPPIRSSFKFAKTFCSQTKEETPFKEARIGSVRSDGKSVRWFKKVGIKYHKTAENEGWFITLDDRVMRSPADSSLLLPSHRLALMLSAEWDSQQERILPSLMPLMTLSATAVDVVSMKRPMVVDGLMSFLKTDVVCCRHVEEPLFVKQKGAHDPLVDWFSSEFCVPPLKTTNSLNIQQPEEILSKIQWMLFTLDDWTLSGLDSAAVATKSLVLALALWKNKITVEEAVAHSRIEEEHQIGYWGEITGRGGHDMERSMVTMRVAASSVWLDLLPKKKR